MGHGNAVFEYSIKNERS